jgi:hypothetical protein
MRETAAGVEPVTDPWAAGALKRQGREILAQCALIALALTGLALLAP